MAYDQELANRLRECVQDEPGVTEKRMFGGLAFLIDGNMAVSASSQGGLMVRVDPQEAESLVADGSAQRFVMRGREMDGWLHVRPEAVMTSDDLIRKWR
jgi:TfoX/Sxy family transcriptional regulator of competence genes